MKIYVYVHDDNYYDYCITTSTVILVELPFINLDCVTLLETLLVHCLTASSDPHCDYTFV